MIVGYAHFRGSDLLIAGETDALTRVGDRARAATRPHEAPPGGRPPRGRAPRAARGGRAGPSSAATGGWSATRSPPTRTTTSAPSRPRTRRPSTRSTRPRSAATPTIEPQTEAALHPAQLPGPRRQPRPLARGRRTRASRSCATTSTTSPTSTCSPCTPTARAQGLGSRILQRRLRRRAAPRRAQRRLRQPERRAPLRARRDAPGLAGRRLPVGAATLGRRDSGQHRRSRRPHADGRAHPPRPGRGRAHLRQARGLQPRRLGQGPDRRGDDRGGRTRGPDRARPLARSSRPPAATPASRWRSSARPRATS